MSDYDQLRRGAYRPDARARATEQEARELSRENYHPDALSKAAEQEAAERAAEERAASARSRVRARSRSESRDIADHTVMHRAPRTTERRQSGTPMGGGAVVSRQSGLGAALRRMRRRNPERDQARADARRQRAWEREQRRLDRGSGGIGKVLLVLAVVLVALYVVVCGPIDRAIGLSRAEREGLSSQLSFHVPATPYYVLALGSDAREGEEVSRTDTMILVRVDLLGGKLTMLSIPRDTKVEIAGHGTQKINAAYAFGGTAGAVEAVHKLTGAPISQVAAIRFEGIESLVDYLGGVTVNVPVPVNDPSYTGLVLPAGEQHMDGHTALLFSRARYGFELGDYQRQKDQRILIEAIMHEVLSMPPWELPGVVGHMGGLVGTTMRMYSIIPLMVRLKLAGDATVYQATVPSTTAMIDGVSYVVADEAQLAEMMAVIDAGGDPAEIG